MPFLRKGLCVIDTDMLRLSFEDTGEGVQRCAALLALAVGTRTRARMHPPADSGTSGASGLCGGAGTRAAMGRCARAPSLSRGGRITHGAA